MITMYWNKLFKTLYEEDYFSMIAVLSVATIYFWFGFAMVYQEIALLFLGIAIFWRRAATHPIFWLLFWILQSIDLSASWITAANHSWVMWYWGLAMFCASCFTKKETRELIAMNNARWLLIIIMLVAVFWKGINPYYMDGSFFERNLITNSLMETFTHTVTGLPWETFAANRRAQNQLFYDTATNVQQQYSNTAAHYFAIGITWWVLLIELVIGVLLLFYRKAFDTWAHICHMFFIWAAYLGAPILGFAWILTVLGLAVTNDDTKYLRPWYFITLLILILYGLPLNLILFNILDWYPLW